MEKFQTNSDIHSVSKSYRYDLHVPKINLSKHQKGVYCSRIKLFNKLPPNIRSLNHDIKMLKSALKVISYLTPILLKNLPQPKIHSGHRVK
jgi:hypothetical protein